MPLTEAGYKQRLIDPIISRYLKTFGAVSVEGPKWSGKTWTSLNHAESVFYVGDPSYGFSNRRLAKLDPEAALAGAAPRLIDERQEVPGIWDAVRFAVDKSQKKGAFILTGSATPVDGQVKHSGAGRITRITMKPMTLFESGDSQNLISLKALLDAEPIPICQSRLTLDSLIRLIIRGGWPNNIDTPESEAALLPHSYLDALVRKDMSDIDGVSRNQAKVRALLRSLGRNNATLVTNKTLAKDTTIETDNAHEGMSLVTLIDYLEALKRLFVLDEIPAWSPGIRASIRLRVSPKRQLVDPSLAVAAMNADKGMLLHDLKTLGFLFESLCLRDLLVYATVHNGAIHHYLDSTGLDIDAILELPGGAWAAFEIKLGVDQVEEASHKLLRLKSKVTAAGNNPPCSLAVLVGIGAISEMRSDGVAVIPMDCLAP